MDWKRIVCGVSGYFGDVAMGAQLLLKIMTQQECRGPDDSGTWEKTLSNGLKVGLGHNRLSIIDLSDAGHQPMSDIYNNVAISFNGEIYNYKELRVVLQKSGWRFKSSSDTEVLLAAYSIWGELAFEKLNGMFAIIIVDQNINRVTLVRSRMGSKPLHYRPLLDGWAFASTSSSLATILQTNLDIEYLLKGSASWIYESNTNRSVFNGIYSVQPGTTVSFKMDDPKCMPTINEWYSLVDKIIPSSESLSDMDSLATQLRDLVTNSVKLRLRSDVPVGVSLSGGLDSTILASCMANSVSQPFHAFTFTPESDNPESRNIPKIENRLKQQIILHRIKIPSLNLMGDSIDQTLRAQDAPFSNFSVIAQNLIYKEASNVGIKVMLSGQGSDEILMGYSKYRFLSAIEAMRKGELVNSLQYFIGLGRSVGADPKIIRSYISAFLRPSFGGREVVKTSSLLNSNYKFSNLQSLSLLDVTASSLPTLLRFEDGNSMAWSVESRLPFLDFRLVEFCLSLPDALKVQPSFGKYLLRKAFADSIPAEIAWNKAKIGFESRNSVWLQHGAGTYLRAVISDSRQSLLNSGFPVQVVNQSQFSSDSELDNSATVMSNTLMLSWAALRVK
jgi:asparagine synthase (glutamine-hydrolysing)